MGVTCKPVGLEINDVYIQQKETVGYLLVNDRCDKNKYTVSVLTILHSVYRDNPMRMRSCGQNKLK